MAPHGWGKSSSVIDWLFDEGDRFDFFQAVALLEANVGPPLRSVGEGAEPALEVVRFKSTIDLSFPEADVASAKRPRAAGDPILLTVNFLSLAGASGPLPLPFAEIVMQRAARGDTALRDFLDIFNHRLVSLVYRARKRSRIGLGVGSPEQDDAARYLGALVGLGTPGLQGRLGVPDRALLHHAGLFAKETRSAVGLEGILRNHFGLPIEVHPLTGCYCPLEPLDWTTIGPSGKNRALGRDAVLGGRVWDQEAAFDVKVGPVELSTYLRFLPGGDAIGPLCDLTRFYAGEAQEFRVRLVLHGAAIKPAKLGKGHGARLGYTAWLGGEASADGVTFEDPEIVIEGAVLAAIRRRDPRQAARAAGPQPGDG